MNNQDLEVGQMVRLKRPMLGNPAGAIGYVFSTYEDFDDNGRLAAQIIFPNGDYDGFSVKEQSLYLEIGVVILKYSQYEFMNVIRVSEDYRNGYWDFSKDFVHV